MTLNDSDKVVDEIANNKKKIQVIKRITGEFYGCVEFKGIPAHYTSLLHTPDLVIRFCRQWISENIME